MKKLFFLVFLLGTLASCGNSQEKIDAAKQTLLEQSASGTTQEVAIPSEEGETAPEELSMESGIEIVEFGQSSFLKFDTLKIDDFLDGEAEISGETLTDVESITVEFSNTDSTFPKDTYKLQTFNSGDARFVYRASSGFKVLDFGENIYTFRATSAGKVSETQVIVRLPRTLISPDEDAGFQETQLIGTEGNTLLLDLPTSSKYGEPVRLGEASFTYSGIQGLEIEKKILPPVSCDTLSQYLSESQKSWYFWNTCRELVKEKAIMFNIIRIEGENYIYERQYIDFEHGLFGTFEIEKGTGVTKDTIQEKNTQLKDQIFPVLDVVDDLMKDIVKL